jgi:hypothetical protein
MAHSLDPHRRSQKDDPLKKEHGQLFGPGHGGLQDETVKDLKKDDNG